MKTSNYPDRGVEIRRHTDAVTSRTVLQLTASDRWESQHTYYDFCPWSPDGRLILFSSLPVGEDLQPFGHDTLASPNGCVNVMDAETWAIRQIAPQAIYMRHGGAFCMWHRLRNEVFYRRDLDHTAAVDVETGAERLLPGRVRQLSPDGRFAAAATRCVHGHGQGKAIGVMDVETGELREIVDREQLHALAPNRDEFTAEDLVLGNAKWHPDGEHILVTGWIYPRPQARRSLYVVGRDGTGARWLTHFAHHHSWSPDGASVLFNDSYDTPDGRREGRMYFVDFDGSNRRIAFDEPVGSHPLLHPTGDRIVDSDAEGIWQVHLGEQRLERLAEFTHPFRMDHHGTHPHPVWSRDGEGVLYNSAETGHSELYFLPDVGS